MAQPCTCNRVCAATPAVLGCRAQVSFEVRSPSSGVVGEYFANEGDTVAVGQPLFRLTAGEAPAAGGAKGGASKADASASGGEAAGSAEAKEMVVDVPNLGDSIVDGTLSDIAVQPGGDVAVDDVVAVIDTDKVRRHACTHPPHPCCRT